MLKALIVMAISGMAGAAWGQEYQVKSGEPLAGDEKPAAAFVVRTSDCRWLRRYKPNPAIVHQPGTAGGPDYNAKARNLAIAIKVVADDYLPPVGPNGRSAGGEGFLGFVELRDGVPYVDGEPLVGSGAADLAAACGFAEPAKESAEPASSR